MTCATDELAKIADGLWANAEDSLRHTLDHFTERDQTRANRKHHDKWIILSVHHAAESICNMRLLQVEPTKLIRPNGSIRFPSLTDALTALGKQENNIRLTLAERRMFILMGGLPDSGSRI
jgi:hypothetical protein